MFKNKSKFITISTIISLLVALCFLCLTIIYVLIATNPNGESSDGYYILVAVLITAPVTIVALLSFVFSLVTFLTRKIWGVIITAIITAFTTIVLIFDAFDENAIMFLIALAPLFITVCSILGAIRQKKINELLKSEIEP